MQKTDAEKMLLQCASGTFLIRFSEGEPGGISVAWVTGEGDNVPVILLCYSLCNMCICNMHQYAPVVFDDLYLLCRAVKVVTVHRYNSVWHIAVRDKIYGSIL